MSMNEQMSLEEYKKQVKDCLINNCDFTEQLACEEMKSNDNYFQEYYEDKWTPAAVAVGLAMNFL